MSSELTVCGRQSTRTKRASRTQSSEPWNAHCTGKPPRRPKKALGIVRVEERQQPPARLRGSEVSTRTPLDVAFGASYPNLIAELREYLSGAVRGAIIDDDDLERWRALGQD